MRLIPDISICTSSAFNCTTSSVKGHAHRLTVIVDDRAALPRQSGETKLHRLRLIWRVPNPTHQFTDHFHRSRGAVGVCQMSPEPTANETNYRVRAFVNARLGTPDNEPSAKRSALFRAV